MSSDGFHDTGLFVRRVAVAVCLLTGALVLLLPAGPLGAQTVTQEAGVQTGGRRENVVEEREWELPEEADTGWTHASTTPGGGVVGNDGVPSTPSPVGAAPMPNVDLPAGQSPAGGQSAVTGNQPARPGTPVAVAPPVVAGSVPVVASPVEALAAAPITPIETPAIAAPTPVITPEQPRVAPTPIVPPPAVSPLASFTFEALPMRPLSELVVRVVQPADGSVWTRPPVLEIGCGVHRASTSVVSGQSELVIPFIRGQRCTVTMVEDGVLSADAGAVVAELNGRRLVEGERIELVDEMLSAETELSIEYGRREVVGAVFADVAEGEVAIDELSARLEGGGEVPTSAGIGLVVLFASGMMLSFGFSRRAN